MPHSFHPTSLLYIEYGGRSDHAINPTCVSGSASVPSVSGLVCRRSCRHTKPETDGTEADPDTQVGLIA
ncbi:hypothetical protein JEM70_16455 [Bacillaceae bacterium HSR45]|nr:hypothetical protein [Bacillaceae bacterium HSR45]